MGKKTKLGPTRLGVLLWMLCGGRLDVAYRETVAAVLSTNSVRHADLCVPAQTSSTTSPRSRATARAPPSSSFS